MTAAAGNRTTPDAKPATTIRTKPVRVSLDLDPDLYGQLTRWTQSAAPAVGTLKVTHADALRALVTALERTDVTAAVLEILRET